MNAPKALIPRQEVENASDKLQRMARAATRLAHFMDDDDGHVVDDKIMLDARDWYALMLLLDQLDEHADSEYVRQMSTPAG